MKLWIFYIFVVGLIQRSKGSADLLDHGVHVSFPGGYWPTRQMGSATGEAAGAGGGAAPTDKIGRLVSLWSTAVAHMADEERITSARLDKLEGMLGSSARLNFPYRCPLNPGRVGRPVPVGVMRNGDHLYSEEEFCSIDGESCLFLRSDGNLLLYRLKTFDILWSSGTSRGHCSADLTNVNGRVTLFTLPPEVITNKGKPVTRISWTAPYIQCRKYIGQDITPKEDMAFTQPEKELDCCKLCMETPNCKAFSWSSNTCWFKSSNGPLQYSKWMATAKGYVGIPIDIPSELELTFSKDGHLCLKGPAGGECVWSTRDAVSADVIEN